MKKGKRIVLFLMAAVFSLTMLSGCGSKSEEDFSSEPVSSGALVPQEQQENSSGSESVVYHRGTWEGNTYTNESLGFVYTMPEGWTAATDEEIMETMDAGYAALTEKQKKNYDYSREKSVNDFLTTSEDGTNGFQLAVENLGLTKGASNLSEEEYAQVLKGQMEQLSDLGYQAGATYSIQLHGKEYLVLPFKVTALELDGGRHLCQDYILRKQGQLMTAFIFTYIEGQEKQTEDFLNTNLKALS